MLNWRAVVLVCLLPLAACMEAQAQVGPAGSVESTALQASTPVGLRCFAVDSTTDYLTDGTNPLFIPYGTTLRLYARGELCAAFVQSVDDLTFDTTTCAITDAATTCGAGASVCPDGAGAGLALAAGAVDYMRVGGKSFSLGQVRGTGVAVEPIARRVGACENAAGVESEPRIPCDEAADCAGQGSFTDACDTTPTDYPHNTSGGFIAAGAASATSLCVSWF